MNNRTNEFRTAKLRKFIIRYSNLPTGQVGVLLFCCLMNIKFIYKFKKIIKLNINNRS